MRFTKISSRFVMFSRKIIDLQVFINNQGHVSAVIEIRNMRWRGMNSNSFLSFDDLGKRFQMAKNIKNLNWVEIKTYLFGIDLANSYDESVVFPFSSIDQITKLLGCLSSVLLAASTLFCMEAIFARFAPVLTF